MREAAKGISTRLVAVMVTLVVIVVGLGVGSSGVLNSTGSTKSSTSIPLGSTAASSASSATSTSFSSSVESSSSGANVTVEVSNSTPGLELLLSVNSTTIPSEDAIDASARVMSTRSTANNLTAVDGWPIDGLTSGPCSGGWYPLGIAFFRGYYNAGNITGGKGIEVWPVIGCPAEGPINVTSYSFLPNADVVNYSGYFPGPFPNATRGKSSTLTNFSEPVYAANGTGFFNSLGSALPSTYTLAAGDEWGQLVLLHFRVTPSGLLPKVGNFLSVSGGCSPGPCDAQRFSDALVFNCATAAATPSGCSETWSDTTRYSAAPIVNYTVTVWYPSYNQPNEPASANCIYTVFPVGALGKPSTVSFGYCLMVNSTSFVVSPRP